MRKTILILILMLGIVFGASSQDAGPIDLVVILDTSVSMSTYHWETSDYLIGPFLREFLRIGDTFHLISFAETPRMEISRRIEGQGDVETIIARLLLMYPLGSSSNVGSALNFAESYVAGLPGNRPRKLVLISDGSAPGTVNLVNAASGRLRNVGAELQFIRVPVVGDGPASGRPPAVAAMPAPPPVTQPPGVQPPVTQPPVTQPPGVQPPVTQPPGVQPPVTQPPVTQPPPGVQPAEPRPAGVSPFGDIPLALLILLGLLVLAILALIIFFVVRNLHSSPNRVMSKASRPSSQGRPAQGSRVQPSSQQVTPASRRAMPKDVVYTSDEDGPMMLSLFVEDQNTAIGRRNIHSAKDGHSFSVGGGKSDFLIFLVPMPSHIADVQCNGRNCTFIPRKSQYFPDIGSQSVPNCIGKSIRVVSDKNYELFIRVERYEDPLKALNKLLNSISVPG